MGFHRPRLLDGQVFGRLTVVERVENNKRGQIQWLCLCECGENKIVTSINLVAKTTKSCGCLKRQIDDQRFRTLKPYEAVYRLFVRRAVHPVELSLEDFVEFTKFEECHYCSHPLRWLARTTLNEVRAYNLDRKDNLLGYTKENCVPCCGRCNHARGARFTYEEWLDIGAVIRSWKNNGRTNNYPTNL